MSNNLSGPAKYICCPRPLRGARTPPLPAGGGATIERRWGRHSVWTAVWCQYGFSLRKSTASGCGRTEIGPDETVMNAISERKAFLFFQPRKSLCPISLSVTYLASRGRGISSWNRSTATVSNASDTGGGRFRSVLVTVNHIVRIGESPRSCVYCD